MEETTKFRAATPQDRILPFEYPSGPDARMPAWDGLASFRFNPSRISSDSRGNENAGERVQSPKFPDDASLQEERRRSFEAGRQTGLEEGRAAGRKEATDAGRVEKKQHMQRAAAALAALAEQRDRYLSRVESEVVTLALDIAARILRREAQMDPLLLTGAVRVALGQLSNSTKAQLFVPASELEMWKETLVHFPNLPLQPEILPGEGMQTGDCSLRTEVGSVDLGLRAQLREIEQGFFDKADRGRSPKQSVVVLQAEQE